MSIKYMRCIWKSDLDYRMLPNKGSKRDIGLSEDPFYGCIYGDFSTPKFNDLLSCHF